MENIICISHPTDDLSATLELPGSKSESNRALIINALSGNKSSIINLANSSDTKILKEALANEESLIDIRDAGTAMRFLIAYYSVKDFEKTVTGSPRMLERPVGPLVDALNSIGANIEYLEKPGFPPIKVNRSNFSSEKNHVKIPANISSQFISALLMIAPTLPGGLEIELEGKISSSPYIDMTLHIMKHFKIESEYSEDKIIIKKQNYIPTEFSIESDWSSAAFWYAMTALSENPAIFLKGLRRESLQGDAILAEWFKAFGVITEFGDNRAFLTKGGENSNSYPEIIDFCSNPDLALTVITLCAAKNLKCRFTGLESLRIKETDRIQALQNELIKFDISLLEESNGIFSIKGVFNSLASPIIETYNDHRMAMAFASLSLICKNITIKNPSCIRKSYPEFWEGMKLAGFIIQ